MLMKLKPGLLPCYWSQAPDMFYKIYQHYLTNFGHTSELTVDLSFLKLDILEPNRVLNDKSYF